MECYLLNLDIIYYKKVEKSLRFVMVVKSNFVDKLYCFVFLFYILDMEL